MGMDAMLSTVQMPAGMPVATVALGKSGAINAAYLAMQILAITDKELSIKLKEDRIVKSKKLLKDWFKRYRSNFIMKPIALFTLPNCKWCEEAKIIF